MFVPAASPITVEITALHQSPGERCFKTDDRNCELKTWSLFDRLLRDHTVDFGSLINGGNYLAQSGWKQVDHLTGMNKVSLLWDDDKWSKEALFKSSLGKHHAVILSRFRNRLLPDVVIVVGSFHYPRSTTSVASLKEIRHGISKLRSGNGTWPLLVLADTNSDHVDRSAATIFRELGDNNSVVWSTPPLATCCGNDNYNRAFDKIVLSGGDSFEHFEDSLYGNLTANYSQTPPWARVANGFNAYRHPIMAKAVLSFNISSGNSAVREVRFDDDLTGTWLITLGSLAVLAIVFTTGSRGAADPNRKSEVVGRCVPT